MKFLDILMVCSPDRFLPQIVVDSLLIQNIPLRIFFSNVSGDGAASARNYIKSLWQTQDDKSPFVLMTDNDIIFPEGSLQAMLDFLEIHPDFGAIALHRDKVPECSDTNVLESSHVNAGPVLFRPEVYEQITYHNNNGCECQGMSDNIRELGRRIGYLGDWKYDHIDETRRSDLATSNSEQLVDYLDVLMPCSPNRFVPSAVLDHLLAQNQPIRLIFSNICGDGPAPARNVVKDAWNLIADKAKYCLMTDNDIPLPLGVVPSMIKFMDANEEFGAIGLQRDTPPKVPETEATEPSHVNAGPVLFRPEVYEQITYHNNDGCDCQGQCNDIRNLGRRIGFLGNWTYDHIQNTKRADLIESDEMEKPPIIKELFENMGEEIPEEDPIDSFEEPFDIPLEGPIIEPPPTHEEIPLETEGPIPEMEGQPSEDFDPDPIPLSIPEDHSVVNALETISYQLTDVVNELKKISEVLQK